ncbi:hypothetical protein BD413DRAFT_486057, partial [Trametes elegans]
ILGLAASTLVLLYRSFVSSIRPSRWHGPAHFTIPILSPFSSVVEHESSLFTSPQGLCFLGVAAFFLVWRIRCSLRSK